MKVVDCEQGTPQWYAARLGVPTASEFDSIITPKKAELATAHEAYIDRLLDEMIRPDAERGFGGNSHTERGKDLEPEARRLYAFMANADPQPIGFVLRDAEDAGCSPDSMVGADGGLEIKCPDGPTHVGYLRKGALPDAYKAQVHGSLVITGRKWWDFCSYCPGHRPFIVRVTPDAYTAKLAEYLDFFVKKLAAEKQRLLGDMA